MSTKKSNDNGFDGLVAIQLCTKSWPGIVNLTKEDLGVDKVPELRCSPKGRLARTLEKLAQVQREYLALADEFCEKYDAIRDEWKAFCESKHPGSWELMRPHYPPKEILRRKFDFFWTITEIKAAEPPSKTSALEVIEALNDGVYSPNGQLLRASDGSTARYVGTEISFTNEWKVNRHLTLTAIYCHFFPGRFIRETGPSKQIDFVEITARFLF